MVSLYVAALIVPGIEIQGSSGWIALTVMAIVLAFVNAFVRPLLAFLSCGFIILTMGLFMLVVNALTFWLAASISENWFNAGFIVDGFWPAFWGSIIVSLVSFLINLILPDRDRSAQATAM
jgi:putative membrane protein